MRPKILKKSKHTYVETQNYTTSEKKRPETYAQNLSLINVAVTCTHSRSINSK